MFQSSALHISHSYFSALAIAVFFFGFFVLVLEFALCRLLAGK